MPRSRGTAELSVPAVGLLAGTLEVLRRTERLSTSEIGDHTDLVAEVADALATLTDRMARDLASGAEPTGDAATGHLRAIRDSLSEASSTARRCAGSLYRAHVGSMP